MKYLQRGICLLGHLFDCLSSNYSPCQKKKLLEQRKRKMHKNNENVTRKRKMYVGNTNSTLNPNK